VWSRVRKTPWKFAPESLDQIPVSTQFVGASGFGLLKTGIEDRSGRRDGHGIA
jgi:hypothetical protein